MVSLRTSLLAAASAVVALYAVACAAPAAQKTLVVDCDKTSDDPTCEGSTSKKSGSRSPSTNEDQESQPTDTSAPPPSEPATKPADAGASTPPTLGFYCGKLEACCKALEKKGITGSANQCKSVVSTKNEFACDTTFQTYRTPDDYYDPPTECQ